MPGRGTGFGQTFDVTYDNDGPGNPVTVTAHFFLNMTEVGSVDVATVSDDVGDTVTVTQSGTTSVTISGPGNGSADISVAIHAVDDSGAMSNTADETCADSDANAQIVYNFDGFFSPLNNMATKVKRGSTCR